jgi:competence protein ComEA
VTSDTAAYHYHVMPLADEVGFCMAVAHTPFVAATCGFGKKKPPTHPINVKSARSAELQMALWIGPSTAQKILPTRKSYGAFKGVNDLLAIRGIGEKRLEKIGSEVLVSGLGYGKL